MVKSCCIVNCSSSWSPNHDVTFHYFPKNENMREKWLTAIPPGYLRNQYLKKYSTICSKHFAPESFAPSPSGLLRNVIRKTAVPTIFESLRINKIEDISNSDLQSIDLDDESDSEDIIAPNSLSLFGGCVDNIEFVIENVDENGEISETKLDTITIEDDDVDDIKSDTLTGDDESQLESSQDEIAFLTGDDEMTDTPSHCFEEDIKDEIEIEEQSVQLIEESTKSDNVDDQDVIIVNKTEDTAISKKDDTSQNSLCFVPNCTTDALTCYKTGEKIYLFEVPADENMRKIWDICIDNADKQLKVRDLVCQKHFLKEDIIYKVAIPKKEKDANKLVPYGKPKLKQGAVPCLKFHEECCVPGCKNKSGKMYCFPVLVNSNLCLWLYMIKNPMLKSLKLKDLLKYRVCERHFEPDCFDARKELKKAAAPTLFLPENYTVNLETVKPVSQEEIGKTAFTHVTLMCAYIGCNNVTSACKNVFSFPADGERCELWLKACGRPDLITNSPITTAAKLKGLRYGVCEDHFQMRDFETLRCKLNATAMPKICVNPFTVSNAFSDGSPNTSTTQYRPILMKPEMNNCVMEITGIPSPQCAFKGCTSISSLENPFYSFPSNAERCLVWLRACGQAKLEDVRYRGVCGKHFCRYMFESKYKLKKDAFPLLDMKGELNQNTWTIRVQATQPKPITTCVVENCPRFHSSKPVSYVAPIYNFPDPTEDPARFDIWLKLINTKKLKDLGVEEIFKNYGVCNKHFEPHFFEGESKPYSLNKEAVPTINLPGDVKWFFDSDYFNTRLKQYFKLTDFTDENTGEWRTTDGIDLDDAEDKRRCVLEKDGISFPGMGRYLYVGKKLESAKRKFPYGVYKFNKTGYGLSDDIDIGENIRIHTAIIIDDDDDCEREVLQQLLDKRIKLCHP